MKIKGNILNYRLQGDVLYQVQGHNPLNTHFHLQRGKPLQSYSTPHFFFSDSLDISYMNYLLVVD